MKLGNETTLDLLLCRYIPHLSNFALGTSTYIDLEITACILICWITKNFGYFKKCRGYWMLSYDSAILLIEKIHHIVSYGSYIYDQLSTLDITFFVNHWKMASISFANLCIIFAVIRADGEGCPYLISNWQWWIGLYLKYSLRSLELPYTLTRKLLIQNQEQSLILLVKFQWVMEMAKIGCWGLGGLDCMVQASLQWQRQQVWLHFFVPLITPIIRLYPLDWK